MSESHRKDYLPRIEEQRIEEQRIEEQRIEEQRIETLKMELTVQTEAQSRLRKSAYHGLRLIACEFHEGVLSLRGRVSSFHLKQIAQTLVRGLDGVGEINNRLEVARP